MALITIVPASTKTGASAIRALLRHPDSPSIRAVYRDPSKAPAEFTQNSGRFVAVQGDIGTSNSLDFGGSAAVFYVPPAVYDGTDEGEWAIRAATHVKEALARAGNVPRLVILSAVGSQHEQGTGILRLNHLTDRVLISAAPEVILLQPSYFYEEFTPLIEEAAATSTIRSWLPLDYEIPMISNKDIGKFAAEKLLAPAPTESPHCVRLYGPRAYGAKDIRSAVARALGKKRDEDIQLVVVPKESLVEYFSEFVPPPYTEEVAGLALAGLPGGLVAGDFANETGEILRGEIELGNALKEIHEAK